MEIVMTGIRITGKYIRALPLAARGRSWTRVPDPLTSCKV